MPRSLSAVWIHAIWSTKRWVPFLQPDIEKEVHDFIRDQLNKMDCSVRIVNGMPDHVHCLFRLNREKSLADVIKQIKGSSSFYINDNELILAKFAWQNGYAAYSVSKQALGIVYNYILNQKRHHENQSLSDELEELLRYYGEQPDK